LDVVDEQAEELMFPPAAVNKEAKGRGPGRLDPDDDVIWLMVKGQLQ